MSDAQQQAGVREDYRPLTTREREILEMLLSVEAPGIDELRKQVPHVQAARWSCGCASFNLSVPLHEFWRGGNVGLLLKGATVGTSSCFLC
jgi:hypothetical protein